MTEIKSKQVHRGKKVLLFANDTTYIYNLRDQLLVRLIDDGYEVVVVAQPLLYQDEIRALGCKLIGLEFNRHGTNPLMDLKMLWQVFHIIILEKPSCVLTYNIKPNVYGGLVCRMTNTYYLPNITGLGMVIEKSGILLKLATRLYKMGIAGAHSVFFQNEENQEFFLKNGMLRRNCKTILIPGSGVNLKRHCPLDYPTEKTMQFLFVARVMQAKGIDLYLEVAKRINAAHEDAVFHICGYCDDPRYLNLLHQECPYIVYHGEQKDMVPFYRMAHCIVHPSYYHEGMSNVLLEAAAHCRPVITTDCAGCRETVDDGTSGYIVANKDVNSLYRAVHRFMHLSWEQRMTMGVAGRRKMEVEFDRKIVVEKYIKAIGECLEK